MAVIPWTNLVPVLVGAAIAFGAAFIFRKLDHRRARLAFKVQTRTLLSLLESRLNLAALINFDDDTFDRTVERLNNLFSSEKALFAMRHDSLDRACNLLVALDQIRTMARTINAEKQLYNDSSMQMQALQAEGADVRALAEACDRLTNDVADHTKNADETLKRISALVTSLRQSLV